VFPVCGNTWHIADTRFAPALHRRFLDPLRDPPWLRGLYPLRHGPRQAQGASRRIELAGSAIMCSPSGREKDRGSSAPWVRIPPSPPIVAVSHCLNRFLSNACKFTYARNYGPFRLSFAVRFEPSSKLGCLSVSSSCSRFSCSPLSYGAGMLLLWLSLHWWWVSPSGLDGNTHVYHEQPASSQKWK
jgi:hypothetical protein